MNTTDTESGEYEGGFQSPDIQSEKMKFTGDEFVLPSMNKPAPPPYHTTTELQALVAAKTGKPCNSRNRPALLKKLGMAPEKPTGATPHQSCGPLCQMDGKTPRHHAACPGVRDKAARRKPGAIVDAGGPGDYDKISRATPAKVNGKRPGKPRPNKVDHHAIALAYVKKAMARVKPPSLFSLMCEMNEKKIKTPTGDEWRWKSSVQSLMRQAEKAR